MQLFCKAYALAGIQNSKCDGEMIVSNFDEHIQKFGLSFATKEEYLFRMELFQKKDAELRDINERQSSFTVAHNIFSTMTKSEAKRLSGAKIQKSLNITPTYLDESAIPDSQDWRTKGAVTDVMDQKTCAADWAISASESIESAHFIQNNNAVTLQPLSAQQFIDCDIDSFGCNGGFITSALKHAEQIMEDSELQYPFTAQSAACQEAKQQGQVKVKSFNMVPVESANQLRAAIFQQPVSVMVASSTTLFQNYQYGIINDVSCGVEIDRALTAVGYGLDSVSGQYFYILKNSFGTSWGEQGYVRIMATNGVDKGICGVQQYSLYPTTEN